VSGDISGSGQTQTATLLVDARVEQLEPGAYQVSLVLIAVAVVTFRTAAFPAWLGWLSVVAALAQLVPVLGIALDGGPLAADGWLSAYLPYPLYAVWLACTAIVTVARLGSPGPLLDSRHRVVNAA